MDFYFVLISHMCSFVLVSCHSSVSMDTNSIITAVIHSVHLLPVHTRVYFIIKDILHWNLWTFIFIVFIFVTITIYQLFTYLFKL